MNETMDLINQSANERHHLYVLASHQHLTPQQVQRLDELNSQLPILWDQHRRELASQHYPRIPVSSPAFNWLASDDADEPKSRRRAA